MNNKPTPQSDSSNNNTPNPKGTPDKQKLSKKKHNRNNRKTNSKEQHSSSSSGNESEPQSKPHTNHTVIKDLIADNFVMLSLIGKGAFGEILLSFSMRDNMEVAVKKEVKKIGKVPQLRTEAKIYQSLLSIQPQDISGSKALSQEEIQGVPKFYGMGEIVDYYYLIIEFLGPNLVELLNYCKTKKFTISTVCLIAMQVINRIENIHKHNFIHRDIKPENFLIGSHQKSNIIYLIDFGLSKRYKNPKNHQHIPYREGRPLTGTARYVSISTHLGIEQSRRDDLESIGYVLVFFLKGTLPWQGLKNGGDKYQRIMEKKLQIPTEMLCHGLPEEFALFINYSKSLRFEDRPDYDYIRGLFLKLLVNCTSTYGLTKTMLKFDWCFDDPKKSIWVQYENAKKQKNTKARASFSKGKNPSFKDNSAEHKNSTKKVGKESNNTLSVVGDKMYGKKQLSNIDETIRDNFTKTNENNPNVETDGDDMSSDELTEKNEDKTSTKSKKSKKLKNDDTMKNTVEKIKEENIKNKIQEEKEESIKSDGTVEEDFKGLETPGMTITQDNKELNDILLTEQNNKEDIDNYIGKLITGNGTKIQEQKSKKDATHLDLDDDDHPIKKNNSHQAKKSQRSQVSQKYNQENLINPKLSKPKATLAEMTTIRQVDMKISKDDLIRVTLDPITKHYIILNDLGHGSYGQVKRVKNLNLQEERAMKIVSKKSQTSQNEIDILRKISHPNISNVFEIFEDSRKYYIMMEYLEGGELFDVIISQGFFSELDAAHIMKQILSAVNYLHSKQIVHRDLKPENIMLTNKPIDNKFEIKIIDFGTATMYEPSQPLTKFIGTSYYIAPEVIKENYNEKCDVWSCGIILYILLCGYPPFNGQSNVDIFHHIKHSEPVFEGEEWADITREAIDLIKNMLNKNPAERITAEQCLEHKWLKMSEELDKEKVDNNFKKIQKNTINKMARFVKENRFKKAVLQFISTQFNLKEDENELKDLFKELDSTKKGQISKEVFCEQLKTLYGETDGKTICDKIFEHLDLDGSGQISYDEFLSAMIDSKKIITEERLEKAFKIFDKDGNGRLSVDEIIAVFGGNKQSWEKVIADIDLNKDGDVDFKEFKAMMINIDKVDDNKLSKKHNGSKD